MVSTLDVGLNGMQRVPQDAPHAHGGGQMNHVVGIQHVLADHVGVEHTAVHEFEVGAPSPRIDVGERACAQIVQRDHRVALFNEPPGQMGPDESRSSRNQEFHTLITSELAGLQRSPGTSR